MVEFLLPLLTALAAAGATYLVAVRKTSGRVDTTEAAILWKEAEAMRQELRTEVIDLREQLKEARSEISILRDRVGELEKHERLT